MIFYFSGTGNSAWVARHLAQELGDVALNMARGDAEGSHSGGKAILSETYADEDSIGFVFPVYGWDVPLIVRNFIKELKVENADRKYFYFVATCGDDSGRLLQRFRKLIRPKGWTLNSAFSILMPESYVCLPGFDVDSERKRTAKLKNAPVRLQEITEIIRQREEHVFDTLPGIFPRTKTYILGGLFRRFLVTDKPFIADDSCIGCGMCVKSCPLNNIHLEEGRPRWEGNCTGCLSCYHHCPKHAIQYGRQTKNKGQYLLANYLQEEK